MHHYRVIFGDNDPEAFGAEEFAAPDVRDALFHIATVHAQRPVELWEDGVFLGQLELVSHAAGTFWRIAPSEP